MGRICRPLSTCVMLNFCFQFPSDTAPEFLWELNVSIEKRMIGLRSASYNKSISYMLFFSLANTISFIARARFWRWGQDPSRYPRSPRVIRKTGQYLDLLQPSALLLTRHARGYGRAFFAPNGLFFVILYVMFWVTVDILDYSDAIFNQRRLYYWIAVKFVTLLRKRVDRFFP